MALIERGSKNKEGVKNIQTLLVRAGYDINIDGDFGDKTEDAVRAYQATTGLEVDGKVGDKTLAMLRTERVTSSPNPVQSVIEVAPWLSTMRAITGTKEIPGDKDNPFIINMAKVIVAKYPKFKGDYGWYNHDSIPWCGLGLAYSVTVNDIEPAELGLSAKAWAEWGQPLKTPTPGAVMVYSRKGGGHVTLYESEDANYYYCRGGNQSDSVNITKIPKSRKILAIRWPLGPLPSTGRKQGVTGNAVASGKEA